MSFFCYAYFIRFITLVNVWCSSPVFLVFDACKHVINLIKTMMVLFCGFDLLVSTPFIPIICVGIYLYRYVHTNTCTRTLLDVDVLNKLPFLLWSVLVLGVRNFSLTCKRSRLSMSLIN